MVLYDVFIKQMVVLLPLKVSKSINFIKIMTLSCYLMFLKEMVVLLRLKVAVECKLDKNLQLFIAI